MKTNENKQTFKRIVAFALDFIIVSLIVSMFAEIELINPNIEKYTSVYNDYYSYILSLTDTTQILNGGDILNNFNYQIAYYSVVTTLISLIVTILYFVVFQYFNKGKTIGKALFKIKVVNDKGEKPSIIQLLLRSLIINSIVTTLLGCILVVYTSKDNYLLYSGYIEYIDMGLLFVTLGMMLIRKDGRGLHDLFGRTNVVSTDKGIKYTIKEVDINLDEPVKEVKEIETKVTKKVTRKKKNNEDSNR